VAEGRLSGRPAGRAIFAGQEETPAARYFVRPPRLVGACTRGRGRFPPRRPRGQTQYDRY
jgi:hypothetical protein